MRKLEQMRDMNAKYAQHCTKANRPSQPTYRQHQEFSNPKRTFYHSEGKCLGYGWTDGVVTIARNFKFLIAMENSRINGYNTEKLFNAFYAQSIPIYFGDPTITEFINSKSFINCEITDEMSNQVSNLNKNDGESQLKKKIREIVGPSLKECVEKVQRVDQNDTLYEEMLLAKVFIENTPENTPLDKKNVAKNIRNALILSESYLLSEIP